MTTTTAEKLYLSWSVQPRKEPYFKKQHRRYGIVGFNVPLDTDRSTIRYDSVYLTYSKKLTGSQLSLPHGINRKIIM